MTDRDQISNLIKKEIQNYESKIETDDVGSVIYGEEAVSCGLIDSIGTLSDALDYLHSSCDEAKKDS